MLARPLGTRTSSPVCVRLRARAVRRGLGLARPAHSGATGASLAGGVLADLAVFPWEALTASGGPQVLASLLYCHARTLCRSDPPRCFSR